MTYTNKQKTELRKSLKSIGYNCSISEKLSPFSDNVVTFISLILPNGTKISISGGNVYGRKFIEDHAQAIGIINKFTCKKVLDKIKKV